MGVEKRLVEWCSEGGRGLKSATQTLQRAFTHISECTQNCSRVEINMFGDAPLIDHFSAAQNGARTEAKRSRHNNRKHVSGCISRDKC